MSESPAATSISAAAQAYQLAMAQQAVSPTPAAPSTETSLESHQDVVMNDIVSEVAASSAHVTTGGAAARTGTPARMANGGDPSASRAASQHPEPPPTMPNEAPPHGAPVRQYFNSKVTASLIEGMKQLAKDQ
ncbi:MAG: hypothetical protein M1818_001460 [Claussenomyces sp. TS43310]|nr:MAG: hypothetical protein M1818_001460 [Claussenomyces sp. TS43310]